VSSMPLGARMKPENHESATIGKAVKVIGQIYTKEDLFVDGDLEGTVEALEHKLTIGPNGKVHADVKAREVVVLGSLLGDVEATDKIEIWKDARLVGNIKTARILIEDGVYFKGGIEVVKREDEIEAKRLADGAGRRNLKELRTIVSTTERPLASGTYSQSFSDREPSLHGRRIGSYEVDCFLPRLPGYDAIAAPQLCAL